jgi:hypothetical protein
MSSTVAALAQNWPANCFWNDAKASCFVSK